MLNENSSASARLITSLKVVALVTVLATVVLAAEQRFVSAVPHEPTIAVQNVTTPYAAEAAGNAQQAATDYFPAQFPAPKGEVSEPVPTF